MLSVEEFIVMAHEMGVKLIPCSTSCGLMGVEQDAFRPEAEPLAGAAYFLAEASTSKVTLFI
jgi:peroxiredoxin family protein